MNEFDSYVVDEAEIANGDKGANRIDTMGAYVGEFEAVRYVKSSKGTHGIRFYFKSSEGNLTFSLWIKGADGTVYYRKKWLDYIMGILNVKKLDSEERTVEEKGEKVSATFYPVLEGKKIGLVFSHTISEEGKDDFNLECVFHPQTNLTATEISKGIKEPKAKDKIVRNLRLVDKRGAASLEVYKPDTSEFDGM